jgi:hypothetical protein
MIPGGAPYKLIVFVANSCKFAKFCENVQKCLNFAKRCGYIGIAVRERDPMWEYW